jgi:Fe-S cluster assembly ATP-binding protein
MLSINNLHVSIDDTPIVRGVSLDVAPGDVHVIMGPNGSGKSTLAMTLMGHPRYVRRDGEVAIDGQSIHDREPHERARAGLFLAFQHPMEIAGLSVVHFLREAKKVMASQQPVTSPQLDVSHPGLERRLPSYKKFTDSLKEHAAAVGLDPTMIDRPLNDGFSGGEKKKMEMVQARILDPKYIILDEIDSGLDVDALRAVGEAAQQFATGGKGLIVITHYARLLLHLRPTHVHIMIDGRIVRSGGPALAKSVEQDGYAHFYGKE